MPGRPVAPEKATRRPARWPLPVIAGAVVLALLVVIYPPWRASAVRTTTRYAAVAGVEAATVTDTLRWALAFKPLYAPPRATINGQTMQALATRAALGDSAAKFELRRTTDEFERRFHVPEVLRASGALWRDSVLAKAGIPSVTSYDLSFALDQRWMAARLTVLAAIIFLAVRRRSRR